MPHSGGKICAPYSLDTNRSRASAAVTVVTTTVRIGAERPRDCTTRSTSSHSNAPIAATAYTRPYSRLGSGRLPYGAYMVVTWSARLRPPVWSMIATTTRTADSAIASSTTRAAARQFLVVGSGGWVQVLRFSESDCLIESDSTIT